ncbi:MAG: DUF4960 domain-containing protein, partial [Dysgonamonadaceae bacterium]|nr:DUF4960 domain-containing protein [Dysgonamonadaceae bacterium]
MKNIRLLLTALAAMLATNVVNAENKIAFVTTAASLADLQANGDDDEKAAATWFAAEYPAPTGTILSTSDAGNWDLSQYAAVWIAIDRVGIGDGLPSVLTEGTVLNKMKNYYQAGGNLLLTNHATRYLVNLERTTRFPGIKGDGAGSDNTEVWGVNTIIGSSYDHSEDFLYEGMTPDLTEGTSKKVYNLIGSGYKEDHNSMWDLTTFSYSGDPNIVVNFETENNATVLATWQ